VIGGAIKHVVVANKEIAGRLIDARQEERVTFLPLKELNCTKIDPSHLEKV
jgi:chromosome segregation ATPase